MPENSKMMTNLRQASRPLVVVLAYDGLCTFEFGVAVEVFGLPRPEMGNDWYRFSVASVEEGELRATGGIRMVADGDLSLLEQASLVVIPAGEVRMKGFLLRCARHYAKPMRAAVICSRFVPGCSFWLLRVCSTDAKPPRTGVIPRR